MTRGMTLAVERIADEPRFAARFRTNPSAALRRYRLSDSQIEAIKAGDADSLASHGVDVAAFANGRRHGLRPRLRALAMALGAAGVLVGLQASPAAAARRDRARFGMGRAVRRVTVRASRRMARRGRHNFLRTAGRFTGKGSAPGNVPVDLGSDKD